MPEAVAIARREYRDFGCDCRDEFGRRRRARAVMRNDQHLGRKRARITVDQLGFAARLDVAG